MTRQDKKEALDLRKQVLEMSSAVERATEALRDTESLLQAIADHTPSLLFLKDPEGRYLLVNQRFTEVFGLTREQIIGRTDAELFPPELVKAFRANDLAVLAAGKPLEFEEVAPYADGLHTSIVVKFPLTTPARLVGGIAGIATDITERKRAEEERRKLETQLRQVQKMESLGVLAGGIAHDFNNLLTVMLGNASLALSDLPAGASAQRAVRQIETAAQRAAELTRELLVYAGRGRFEVERVDLSVLVEEMTELLRTAVSKKATLTTDFDLRLPPVRADATQIRQIVMNLIMNASDALGEAGGTITLHTRAVTIAGPERAAPFDRADVPDGTYALLEVVDTGIGMDEATQARMFDPFFTTKFAGRGLGLAAVMGIVRAHGGVVSVSSEPGEGTSFRVYLPCSDETVASGDVEPSAVPWQATGTVLVVDDEPAVRALTRRILEAAGLAVLTAADGREALDLLAGPTPIAAVVLDLTMPVMGGDEVVRALRGQGSSIPIVLMSGYAQEHIGALVDHHEGVEFVAKPFRPDAILTALRRLLAD